MCSISPRTQSEGSDVSLLIIPILLKSFQTSFMPHCPSVKTHFLKVVNDFIINARPAGFGLVGLIRYMHNTIL